MYYSRDFLSKFQYILYSIKESRNENYGICNNIYKIYLTSLDISYQNMSDIWSLSRKIFRTWSKFSGDEFYPISEKYCTYNKAASDGTHWDWNTEYGKLRWELLDFMIESVDNMIQIIDDYIEENEDVFEEFF